MKILGFQSGHDVSYCILENGVPIIHEELERFSRNKMEIGDGLEFFFSRIENHDDIGYFSFGNLGGLRLHCAENSIEKMNSLINKNKGQYFEIGHHLSHASNCFYTSPFENSLIVTVDGGGWENYSTPTSFCIFEGSGNKIKKIKEFTFDEINLGTLWALCTEKIFGLSTGFPKGDQSGTVMSMATLGAPNYLDKITNIHSSVQQFKIIPEIYEKRKFLIEELKLLTEVSEQEKFNVAASLQKFTENTFREYLNQFVENSNHKNLCLSGGVSLNCVMTAKIKDWFSQIENVFCDAVPYDAGLSLGSARYVWHHIFNNPKIFGNPKNITPYLGVKYFENEVLSSLEKYSTEVFYKKSSDENVLNEILNQKIISVFGNGSESGRRSLGNRSILADPRNPKMKNIINEKVKHRQWFRPFAPSILDEKVSEWFIDVYDSPYMSFAVKFKEEKKEYVPSVVHFDGTGRLQTVKKELNEWFYNFLENWEKKSGVPILLNTSFNDTEPIVETPEHAIKCFLKTNIDKLYFFDYQILVSKK